MDPSRESFRGGPQPAPRPRSKFADFTPPAAEPSARLQKNCPSIGQFFCPNQLTISSVTLKKRVTSVIVNRLSPTTGILSEALSVPRKARHEGSPSLSKAQAARRPRKPKRFQDIQVRAEFLRLMPSPPL